MVGKKPRKDHVVSNLYTPYFFVIPRNEKKQVSESTVTTSMSVENEGQWAWRIVKR